jgi:predicted nucleic acid-binding protein
MTEGDHPSTSGADSGSDPDLDPRLARVVADADVLAADLLVGGAAREAMELVRSHSWVELVATGELLTDAEAVVATLADPGLAADWRERVGTLATVVEAPAGDHPALAAAYRGEAAHLLSFDDRLRSARAGASLARWRISVKRPDGFARLFDPAAVYPEAVGGDYPGPDRDHGARRDG